MLTYLLEKLDKIKKDRDLYCSTPFRIEDTRIEDEDTKKKEKTIQRLMVYDFICYDFICRKN